MSLVSVTPGATTAARRWIVAATGTSTAPPAAGTPGLVPRPTQRRVAVITATCTGGTSFDVAVYLRDTVSGEWALDTRGGGSTTVLAGVPARLVIDLTPGPEFWVRVTNFVGMGATADVWVAIDNDKGPT